MKRKITCIICPRSCEIIADDGSGELILKGYGCARGKRYAGAEVTDPVRTLTSTVRLPSGGMLPVRTAEGVPKDKLFMCMDAINHLKLTTDKIRAGDVLVDDLCGTGVKLIAAGNGK